MSIIIGILTVLEVIVCLLLTIIVLMQKPRQEGLGAAFGSGMTDQMFGAQTTNVLQKGTVIFGISLFVLTFLLAVLTSRMDQHNSKATLVDSADVQAQAATLAAQIAKAEKDSAAAQASPAKTEPAKPTDAKPAETKPAAQTPAAPAPAAQPTPTAPAPTPAPAPAAQQTPPAPATPAAPAPPAKN